MTAMVMGGPNDCNGNWVGLTIGIGWAIIGLLLMIAMGGAE